MFKIYTSSVIPNCPYCQKAKDLLDKIGTTYTTAFIEDEPELILGTGHKTVPVIFEEDLFFPDHDVFIGGYSDLLAYLELDE